MRQTARVKHLEVLSTVDCTRHILPVGVCDLGLIKGQLIRYVLKGLVKAYKCAKLNDCNETIEKTPKAT